MSKSKLSALSRSMDESEAEQKVSQLEKEVHRLKSAVEELTVLNDLDMLIHVY